jgi:hypothetical protein
MGGDSVARRPFEFQRRVRLQNPKSHLPDCEDILQGVHSTVRKADPMPADMVKDIVAIVITHYANCLKVPVSSSARADMVQHVQQTPKKKEIVEYVTRLLTEQFLAEVDEVLYSPICIIQSR